jgi:hypothetical protein
MSAVDLERLARRIDNSAAVLLAQRTNQIAWWEFAIAWARPLLSVGATTAVVAALLIVWAISTRPPAPVHNNDTQALLNLLVAPVEDHIINRPNE